MFIDFMIDEVCAKICGVFYVNWALGISEAVFVARTDMIRGHSNLLLSSDIVVDNRTHNNQTVRRDVRTVLWLVRNLVTGSGLITILC